MKLWELTPFKFLCLTLISHISLIYVFSFLPIHHIIISVILFVIIILFSSTVLYHRYLSHKSWNPPRWYVIFFSVLGIFSFTGSTISRTVIHRQHHAFTDKLGDPHSPKIVNWLKIYFPYFNQIKINLKLAKDLIADPLHKFIHQYYVLIILVTFFIFFILFGFDLSVTLVLTPGALCWMNVCILNIFGHYDDGGTNNLTLSLLTFGEGNHKYHHQNPDDPNTGKGFFDPGFFIIKLLNKNDPL